MKRKSWKTSRKSNAAATFRNRKHSSPPRALVATKSAAVNLDVEMETGTGKTYVYIRTMFELNRRYGWSKFIVVVPSIAEASQLTRRTVAAILQRLEVPVFSQFKSNPEVNGAVLKRFSPNQTL
jgi:restriction endonuclease